jgi:biopolymer transport protein ExbD
MAFGRLDRTPPGRPMGDINMTPLIDVMLVLLVIFMVTAPLMAASLKLDLPTSESATPGGDRPAVTVSLDAAGSLSLGREVIAWDRLGDELAAAVRRDPRTELHLRIDQAVPYARVAELIDAAQKAGLTRIGFVTETPAAASPAGTLPPR